MSPRVSARRGVIALALLAGALAAAAYVWLRQDTTHEFDVYWMLPKIRAGQLEDARHPLAFHVASALANALEIFGGSLHERLKAANGLCCGAAVAVFLHAAWLLSRDTWVALAVAATCASLPAFVHFATLMELHGLFLPFAATAIWMACRLAAAPDCRCTASILVLGASTAVATAVHATGHLLAGFLGLWLGLEWLDAKLGWRSVAAQLLGFAASHAAGTLAIGWLSGTAAAAGPAAAQFSFVTSYHLHWRDLHRTIAGEWLWPFLPVSVAWFLALVRGRSRLAFALLLALVAYLGVCQALLVIPNGGYEFHEQGAYLLPIAFAAVFLTVQLLNGPLRVVLVLLTLGWSAHGYTHPAKEPPDRNFGRLALEYLRGHPVRLVVGGFDEFDGIFELASTDPESGDRMRDVIGVPQFILFSRQSGAQRAAELALFFHPKVAGVTSIMTTAALDHLRREGGIYAELVLTALPSLFTMQEVHEAGAGGAELHGVRLDPR